MVLIILKIYMKIIKLKTTRFPNQNSNKFRNSSTIFIINNCQTPIIRSILPISPHFHQSSNCFCIQPFIMISIRKCFSIFNRIKRLSFGNLGNNEEDYGKIPITSESFVKSFRKAKDIVRKWTLVLASEYARDFGVGF